MQPTTALPSRAPGLRHRQCWHVCRRSSLQPLHIKGTPRNQQQQQRALQEPHQPADRPAQQQQQQQQQEQQRAVQPAGQEAKEAEEQLWWVEKFETKRKQLEQQQADSQSNSNSSSSSSIADKQPSTAAAAAAPTAAAQPHPWPWVALQLLQLLVAVSALILWPASLHRAGLYSAKVWLLCLTYMLFFGGGSVWRLVKFGPLASRKQDQQSKTLGTRAAWLLFVCMMPVLHWGAIGGYLKNRASAAAAAAAAAAAQPGAASFTLLGALSLYDVIGLVLLAAAVAINWAAARHLGRAYDRVVAPEQLVTTGPYAWVQHPIYTSYMLLFSGFAMFLHSLGYAVLAVGVSLAYYRSRAALEAEVLHSAFGEAYTQYSARTKLFVPLLL